MVVILFLLFFVSFFVGVLFHLGIFFFFYVLGIVFVVLVDGGVSGYMRLRFTGVACRFIEFEQGFFEWEDVILCSVVFLCGFRFIFL